LIIWSGSNNIAINESNIGIACLSTLAKRCENTNIIIVNAPKRYDLMQASCVNVEVDNFNSKLRKRMKAFNHVQVVESVSQRECYTKHGQHLNKLGKEQMAHRITNCLYATSQAKTPPIPLPWNVEIALIETGVVQTPNTSDAGSDVMETAMPFQHDSCKANMKVPICDHASRTNIECSGLTAASDRDIRSIKDSVPQVESLTQSIIECPDQPLLQTDVKQDEPALRKSTRLKQLPGRKYQNFLC
jgi:hypothetical protein